jgi:hypothetical protein
MKKIILIVLSVILILILLVVSFFVRYRLALNSVNCTNENRNSSACEKCLDKGGKIFQHSFGSNCETEAKDVDKSCTYDFQCSKFNCVYENKDAKKGRCDGFINDNDGIMNCHRKFRSPVKCDFILS